MKSLYELIVSTFGENEKSKKIYKITKIIMVSALNLYIIVLTFLIGLSELVRTEIFYIIVAWLFSLIFIFILIFMIRRITADKMDKLHPMPHLYKVDLKGGKIKFKEPNGENIFEITYKNDYTIKAVFECGMYIITVENEEWTAVKGYTALTRGEFKEVLAQAINFTAEQTKTA